MVANTVQSRKSKGRNLQKEVAAAILRAFPSLEPGDAVSTSMGAGGVDVKLSPAALRVLPFAIECKATESFSLWAAYNQAVANAKDKVPVVVHRKNRTKAVAIIDLEYLLTVHAECDKLAKLVEQLRNKKSK